MIFVFSGTGNSMSVAFMLTKHLNDRIMAVTDAMESNETVVLSEDEAIGFVFPVYSWAPPSIVLQLVSLLKVNQTPSYIYFVCTCGDDVGKTADVFCEAMKERGWKCQAGYSVVMPNTYVCLPGFDIDSADVTQLKLAHATVKVMELVQRIKQRKCGFECHEGTFPRLKTYGIRPIFTKLLMGTKPFHTTDDCISCGKCIQVCPRKNIRWKDGRPVWGDECSMCLACYHHCPKHAIEYGKQTKGKGQYTFPF